MTDYYRLVPKGQDENLEFRRDLLAAAAKDPRVAAQMRSMCAADMLFYTNAFCWTYDPRSSDDPRTAVQVAPFITYPEFQDDAMRAIVECVEQGIDFAMPKSRDMGASWMGLTAFEWMWHFRPNLSFLLISRNEDYVDKRGNPKSLFWKIDFLHRNQPRWLLPTGRWLGWRDPHRRLLHLGNADNGSCIDGESTTGNAGRGDRRTAIFIDEHAAFEVDAGFRVLRATRDTTNCRGFNSTPQGSNNAFYEVVHKTAARVIRLHWSSHPVKNRGLYTTDETGQVRLLDDFRGEVTVREKDGKTKRVAFPGDYPFILDPDQRKLRSPWYDNQCARCVSPQEVAQELDIDFLGSDYPFFDPQFIDMLRKRYCREPLSAGELEFDHETLEPRRFTPHERGLVSLWVTLDGRGRVAADRRFVTGSDISAGTGASNSVTVVADRMTGEKIAVFRTPHMRPTEFAEYSIALARWFNNAFMVWDASGPTGAVFTKRVMAAGYGDVYHRRIEKKVGQKVTDEPGYYLNAAARETLLEEYRAALADQRYVNRSDLGMAECLQFIRGPTGVIEHASAMNTQDPSGARTAHGDEVIADALACLGVFEQREEQRGEEPGEPVGSLAWRISRREAAMADSRKDVLGAGW